MRKKSFDKDIYKKIGINNLIIFCIYYLIEKKEKCTFENLTKECFSFFPGVFSFSHILKWPDSRKLDRPLRALRKKKLITGSPRTKFNLTKSGKKLAEEVSKIFRQEKLKI